MDANIRNYIILAADFITAMMLGAVLIKMLLHVSYKNRIFDEPDATRRVHTIPVPRLGGVSFLPTLLTVLTFTVGFLYRFGVLTSPVQDNVLLIRVAYMLGSGLILYVLGIVDDLTDLDYKIKFVVQIAASALLVSGGLWLNNMYGVLGVWRIPFYIGMPLTLVIMVFITNAINMIDGIDGLASGLSIVTLGVLSVIYIFERRFVFAMTSVTMLGAVFSFWLFNVFGTAEKKTKLYMGDTGSMTLGLVLCFLIVSLCSFTSYYSITRNCKYYILVFSSLLIPMLDVIRLFFTRLIKHKSPFKADLNHIHHRLMRCGLSVKQTRWAIIGADIVLVLLNAVLCRLIDVNILLVLDVLIYTAAQIIIGRKMKPEDCLKRS
ncbi:MAG: undecaprenyl/decaprenyl-phosphate alpha-N-acetylglucosaminyl 1-phosphate transferase [Bacteroidales bacterium]|nr:undecaprenyl/decaprenyl-phosphate alpha-N-acetylglucosaminyl 1-phosphate transferase [Bacteroidales bacterium]